MHHRDSILCTGLLLVVLASSILLYQAQLDKRHTDLSHQQKPKESPTSVSHLELVVCVDPEFIAIHQNNETKIIQYVASVINNVSTLFEHQFFKEIRIDLTNITFFYEDPYTPTKYGEDEYDVSSLLSLFNNYCSTPGNVPSHDYRILLSGKDFQDNVVTLIS